MRRTPSEEEEKEGSRGKGTRTIELPPSRGIPEATGSTRSRSLQPLMSRSHPRSSAAGGAQEQPPGTRTLPLSDVKGAVAEALPVQHSLGIWLLMPESLSRPRRQETFKEAHCSSEHRDTSQEEAEEQQTRFAASRPGSGGDYPGRST